MIVYSSPIQSHLTDLKSLTLIWRVIWPKITIPIFIIPINISILPFLPQSTLPLGSCYEDSSHFVEMPLQVRGGTPSHRYEPHAITWYCQEGYEATHLFKGDCTCIHSKLRSITPVATKVHVILQSFAALVHMDAWYYRISVACDIME